MEKESKKTIKLLLGCLLADIVSTVIAALLLLKDCAFWPTCFKIAINNIKSVYNIVTIAIGVIGFLLVAFTGKEAPKTRGVQFAALLFSLVFIYQCVCAVFADKISSVSTWMLIAAASLFYAYIVHSETRYASYVIDTQKSKDATACALSSLARKKIKKAHQDITSIQIHNVTHINWCDSIIYNIEYIDSAHNKPENLNTSLSMQLTIKQDDYNNFVGFQKLYSAYLAEKNEIVKPSLQKTLKEVVNENIEQLKSDLNSHINTASDITCEDACVGRLILVYFSYLAEIDRETKNSIAGVRCQSLKIAEKESDTEEANLNAKEINQQIFSKFHTGFLGSLLLKKQPYVFYYEGEENSVKANRRYVSFLLTNENAEKEYLVLITLKKSSDSGKTVQHLLNNLLSMQSDFTKCYEKHEGVKNEKEKE